MKFDVKKILIASAISISLVLPIMPIQHFHAFAEQETSETGVEIGDYTYVVKVSDYFNQPQAKSDYFRGLQAIRSDAWDNNWPFNGKPIQTYLAKKNITSKEQYINMVQWDRGLEMLAIQRTYETEVHGLVEHIRANEDATWTAIYKGRYQNAENLSWGISSAYVATYQGWGLSEVLTH